MTKNHGPTITGTRIYEQVQTARNKQTEIQYSRGSTFWATSRHDGKHWPFLVGKQSIVGNWQAVVIINVLSAYV